MLNLKAEKRSFLHIFHASSDIVSIILYVDDLLKAGNKRACIDNINGQFRKKIEMKDSDEVCEVLGLEI